jgi:hypothetical protein
VPEDPKEAMKSRRTSKRWAPESMFCKRMGIPNPYSEEEIVMISKMNHRVTENHKLVPAGSAGLIMTSGSMQSK